jgi:CheY-like chemotaxis protein
MDMSVKTGPPSNSGILSSGILRDVQILVVDNDRDSRILCAFLLESYGAKVTTLSSIKNALDFLKRKIPALLICEMRFLGESVYPLIQQVNCLELSSCRTIPILVTSTCSPTKLAQQLKAKVAAYLLKPIDIDYLVDQVWNLTRLSSSAHLPSITTLVKLAELAELAEEVEAAVTPTHTHTCTHDSCC